MTQTYSFSPPSPFLSQGVFITGTDTGIGKTLVSAILTQALHATYWKPLQTGLSEGDNDTATVQYLAGLPEKRVIPPAYTLHAPLAPHAAAEREGIIINPDQLQRPHLTSPLVIEGSGGLLVPITPSMMIIDLITQLNLPVILVIRSGLGTLNHTLLSLEALYRRHIPVAGIISSGERHNDNLQRIETLGQTRCLLHIDPLSEITPATVQHYAHLISPVLHDIDR